MDLDYSNLSDRELLLILIGEHHDVAQKVASLDRAIMGNGDGEKPGLKGRVARLEDAHDRTRWWLRAIGVATIGAIVTAAAAALGWKK